MPNIIETDNILKILENQKIKPNENIGQHFLIDKTILSKIEETILGGDLIIEVGAGVGQLTEILAQKAGRLISYEIDERYATILNQITQKYKNTKITYDNFLNANLEGILDKYSKKTRGKDDENMSQVVANIPYHLSEPLLKKLAPIDIHSAILVVGEKLAREMTCKSEEDDYFGRLTVLSQTFFDPSIITMINKNSFYPIPSTESALVYLPKRSETELRKNKYAFIFSHLFLTASKSPTIRNVLKESLVKYSEVSRYGTLSKNEFHKAERRKVNNYLNRKVEELKNTKDTQTVFQDFDKLGGTITQEQAKIKIENMNLSNLILDKPFNLLDNSDLRKLSQALRR
jgi:16S rRNA (adenine1518-N6/adenine1519-N6)-dimethyltransferase